MKKTEYNKDQLVILPIANVKVNEWNPKQKETKEYKNVVRSLELYGFRQPILVRESDGDIYEILDGEQRYKAAVELGYQDIPVYNLGKISDTEAKAATIWMEVQVPFDEIDLSKLVVELSDMEVEMPYSEGEINDFRGMAEFDFDFDGSEPDDDSGEDFDMVSYATKMTQDQYDIFMKAVNLVKDDFDCSEGRAIELICADYLSGYQVPSSDNEEKA